MDIESLLINEDFTLIEAMEVLNKIGKKVLFIVKDEKLVASLTDGDVRRWILKKGSLEAKVSDIANFNPKYLIRKDRSYAKEYMSGQLIEALPIVDENMHIVSIIFLNETEIIIREKLDVPVVIMAGGLGTRLYPYTKILPKPLIPIGEIPIAEHIINKFHDYGCSDFFLIVNHKKNMIKAYFNEIEKEYNINFIDEYKPLGTGGGLSLLKGKINSTFILSNCDILIEEDYEKMYRFHKKEKNYITMICSLKTIKVPYGVIDIAENGEIENMREKPELSFLTNTGFYVVEPSVIEELEEDLEIDFPDIIERYKNGGKKIGVFPISENSWLDMGQLDEIEKMRKRLNYDE